MTFRLLVLVLACFLSAGCAKNYLPSECDALDPENFSETSDPFESVNRAVFDFNLVVDRNLFSPAVQYYKRTASPQIQLAVTNLTNNLTEPRNIAAAIMMGEFSGAANSSARLVVNSTLGFLGLINVGGMAGIPYEKYDFGQMFGRWGVSSGPFIVVPFLGPTNIRDTVGTAVHTNYTYVPSNIDGSDTRTFVQLTTAFEARVQAQPLINMLDDQLDPYLFVRESYRQSRLNRVCYP